MHMKKAQRPIATEAEAAEARDRMIAQANATYERRIAELRDLKDARERPTPPDKAMRAWELRQSGKTFAEIGRELGISGGRASILVQQSARYREDASKGAARAELSVRAFNCLRNQGIDPDNPVDRANLSAKAIADSPNLGKKTFAEIAAWLKSKGHELAP